MTKYDKNQYFTCMNITIIITLNANAKEIIKINIVYGQI